MVGGLKMRKETLFIETIASIDGLNFAKEVFSSCNCPIGGVIISGSIVNSTIKESWNSVIPLYQGACKPLLARSGSGATCVIEAYDVLKQDCIVACYKAFTTTAITLLSCEHGIKEILLYQEDSAETSGLMVKSDTFMDAEAAAIITSRFTAITLFSINVTAISATQHYLNNVQAISSQVPLLIDCDGYESRGVFVVDRRNLLKSDKKVVVIDGFVEGSV